jgi:hypothetical protein
VKDLKHIGLLPFDGLLLFDDVKELDALGAVTSDSARGEARHPLRSGTAGLKEL